MSAQAPAKGRPSAAKLRQRAWYRHPRWGRLTALVITALVVAQVTGEQGVRGDLFAALEANFTGSGVWIWLGVFVAIWLVREFAHDVIKAFTSSVKQEAARPVDSPKELAPSGGYSLGRVHVWLPALIARTVRLGNAVLRDNRNIRYAALGGLLIFLVLLPLMVTTRWQQVMVDQIGMFVLVAIGLNVVVGWAGMLDLGFIAFFAIGAYSAAYWTGGLPVEPPVELNNFLVIPLAVVTCLIAGILLGAPTLRLRGDYLAIVTLGFHEIVYLTARNWNDFTGGTRGAQTDRFSVDLGFWSYEWGLDPQPYYWLQLAFVVAVLALFLRLEHSRVGRAWTAIREDEVAAAATGVDTVRFKLLAFAIGASTSGIAGVVYASKLGYINSEMFMVLLSVLALSYVVFGGMGSIPGVLLGTAILVWLPEALRDTVDPQDRYMYLGGLLVVMMIYRPQGLLPSRRRQRELKMAEEGAGGADALGAQPGGARG
ncbi:branched-chain amino acid ABC transporter permease [Streptomyces radicis]|uniref:Branched-chain amino acid ABC transporter permease n=1 Tax=Streptomyces radicis TaxID=1750517 RepID=A0A3A9VVZ4_9ACTN|nr:branched-chain amino acid ABC transporter permease [Streptomyces radicis]RKN04343.1 branched-chain amino acid ABC transporter permease [Streptomyces radicis]RKN14850.1 branched-chain amino acid ABC transporter permease [Streptomyces radicis]